MNTNLEYAADKINSAKTAFDIFGALGGVTPDEKLKTLKHVYAPLVKVVFPESYIGDNTSYRVATQVFPKLARFKEEAEHEIKADIYGQPKKIEPFTIKAQGKTYEITTDPIATGDLSTLFLVGSDLLKIVSSVDDDDLLVNEQTNLKTFREFVRDNQNTKVGADWLLTVPEITSSFRIKDSGNPLRVNVMDYHAGFLNGTDLVNAVVRVNARTYVWMWKRLILLLDWIGHAGLVHGAVLPPHVMFFPDNASSNTRDIRKHSTHLVDWCYSVSKGTKLKAFVSDYIGFYAPEVLQKKPVTTQTDLYMGAKTMIHLVGGDAPKNTFPSGFPKLLSDNLLQCLEHDPKKRPQDLVAYFESVKDVAAREFGPPKWEDLIVPGIQMID